MWKLLHGLWLSNKLYTWNQFDGEHKWCIITVSTFQEYFVWIMKKIMGKQWLRSSDRSESEQVSATAAVAVSFVLCPLLLPWTLRTWFQAGWSQHKDFHTYVRLAFGWQYLSKSSKSSLHSLLYLVGIQIYGIIVNEFHDRIEKFLLPAIDFFFPLSWTCTEIFKCFNICFVLHVHGHVYVHMYICICIYMYFKDL